jgi:hypothetical protein
MKYTDLPNKHDKDLNWDKQIMKEKRIKYLESELASRGRLDGWTTEGLQKELNKLKIKN